MTRRQVAQGRLASKCPSLESTQRRLTKLFACHPLLGAALMTGGRLCSKTHQADVLTHRTRRFTVPSCAPSSTISWLQRQQRADCPSRRCAASAPRC